MPAEHLGIGHADVGNAKGIVITGSLKNFASRSDLKEAIEQKGGKVTGSVTGKTTCLINNDVTSSSAKNKKARDLGVPVVSEEDFMSLQECSRTHGSSHS